MTVFGDRVFKDVMNVKLGPMGGPYPNIIGVLIKGMTTRDGHTEKNPSENIARDSHLQAKERGFRRNQMC